MKKFLVALTLITFLFVLIIPALAGENMIGRQSQNEGIKVLPAKGKVAIDGNLKDWDFSGRIWAFADSNVRNRFSVEAAAMWDKDNLYLAAKWKDPTPMFSTVNPAFNPQEGWKSDSWQLRVLTDQISHITTWYFTEKNMPALHDTHAPSGSGDPQFLAYKENGTDLGQGIEMAYQMDADKKGYVQEIKIPWSVLYVKVPEIKAGLIFKLGNEFLWGDPTGKTWPIHRYADNMQTGITSREFYWTNTRAWGNAELMAAGNVPVRQYVSNDEKMQGTVPIRITIPTKAARFTIAIDAEDGRRVRNLAGDFVPEDYTVSVKKDQRVVEVKWDCLDDQGKPVPVGMYKAVGLSQDGLGAEYDMSFYNPGTPPWQTISGNGAWGADHASPTSVATSGDWMILACPGAEGGSGIWGIAPDGKKKWGEKRGAQVIAADTNYVYAITNSWYSSGAFCRFDKSTGANRPFVLDGKARPFELTFKDILGEDIKSIVTSIAVNAGNIVMVLNDGSIAMLDIDTAAVKKRLKVKDAGVTALAFNNDGKLFAVQSGKIAGVNIETGELTVIAMPGLGFAVGLAIDGSGNLVTADNGSDCQVKAFTPAGALAYTCGKKGGRPIRGIWDPGTMRQMSAVAVDSKGSIWVTEQCETPRRVSVWGKDGKLVRDYIGNSGYAGTDCFIHDEDPTLAYAGPVEMKLDRVNNSWKVTQVLWVPDYTENERFMASPRSGADWGQSSIITSSASGKKISYLYAYKGPSVVFMKRGASWQPVAAIGSVEQLRVNEPSVPDPFVGLAPKDGIYWNDTNKDGKVTIDECIVVKAGLQFGAFWSGFLGADMSIYGQGLVRYQPIRFTDDGAPVYGPAGMINLGGDYNGSLAPAGNTDLLFCLTYNNYPSATPGMLGVDTKTGKVRWTYPNPYPGVHGSHGATMPKPGLMIGAQKICGAVKVNDKIGYVALVRGNLGQDFLFTEDGLYVGSLFQDGRLPADGLPEKESALRGMPMEGFSEGGEPFNGCFVKQSDDKIRLTTGMAREAAMILEIKGLETINRIKPVAVNIDIKSLVKADAENTARVKVAAAPKVYNLARIDKSPIIDANPQEWKDIEAMPISRQGQPDKGSVKLTYDNTNLYALFEVSDSTPWMNEGKDYTRLFKTGDAVDLQLSTIAGGKSQNDPKTGDLRVVFAQYQGKPAAVLMIPVDPTAPKTLAKNYTTGWTKHFDRVELLTDAKVVVKIDGSHYWVEASVPLANLNLTLKPGTSIRGDAGFISSNALGIINTARTYWSNQATNLVNDEPLEAWLYPNSWGEIVITTTAVVELHQ